MGYQHKMSLKYLIEKIRSNNDFSYEKLHDLILSLGLNNEQLHEQPKELEKYYGQGLKIWQYPIQLAKFATYITSLNIDSYLEIGCRYGGTFIFNSEIFLQKNKKIKLCACDIIPISNILSEYSKIQNFTYIQHSSSSNEFKDILDNNTPDFVFIDGDHSYDGVKSDFKLFENLYQTKYIAFHDISSDVCPGVKKMWSELKNDDRFDTLEWCDQYDSVIGNFLGIGLAIRK